MGMPLSSVNSAGEEVGIGEGSTMVIDGCVTTGAVQEPTPKIAKRTPAIATARTRWGDLSKYFILFFMAKLGSGHPKGSHVGGDAS
jgi:hypothetical protein